jgi:alcohol dehydrogenase class IV
VFAGLVAAMAQVEMNPLAEADERQAFHLAFNAYPKLADQPATAAPRIDLCIAAFLQNRSEDDGLRRFRGGTFSGNYAVSTSLHVRYPHVGQGESTCVLQASRIRLADSIPLPSARKVAQAVGVWREGMDGKQAAFAVADWLESTYTRMGMPTTLRQLEIPRDDLKNIAAETVKNFNANAGMRSADEQIADAFRLLEAAY